MLSASWMVSQARVPTPAPASARVVPRERTASVVPGRPRNQPLLNGRVSMGSASVGGSVLAPSLVQRANETLLRAAAIELESILQRVANFMWLESPAMTSTGLSPPSGSLGRRPPASVTMQSEPLPLLPVIQAPQPVLGIQCLSLLALV